MTHLWGFDLSMSAVRLMRREAGYWREIAAEQIDGPDIEERLEAMIAQVPIDTAIHIFLPHDQILYTNVKISSEDNAVAEIDAAMSERTPYALNQLEIDWEMIAPGNAQVAAIAHETLDEALAFAEQRGLTVAEFSSFAEPEDFPRLPDFGRGHSIDETEESAPTFVSTREPSESQATALDDRTEADPVVIVDDEQPVMHVEDTQVAPVPLGTPLPRQVSEPRILTDIAAKADDHARGDSLAPLAEKASPSVSRRGLAIAAVLTLVIGAIIWSVLPDRVEETSFEASEVPAIAANPPEPEALTPDVAEVPSAPVDPLANAPEPVVFAEIAGLSADTNQSAAPNLPKLTDPPARLNLGAFPAETTQPLIPVGLAQQLDATPASLTGVAEIEPGLDSAGGLDDAETLDEVYFASIELPDQATDAIALPDLASLEADITLVTPSPPAAFAATVVATVDAEPQADHPDVDVATLDPTLTPEPELTTTPDQPEVVETVPTLPAPTALAAALPDERPRSRPGGFIAEIERERYGGRTRSELETLRPPTRPQSAQIVALAARAAAGDSGDAIQTSAEPRERPENFDAVVATTIQRQQTNQQQALLDFQTPDTSAAIQAALAEEDEQDAVEATRPQNSPRLAIPEPSSGNVARRATVEDAIRLNRINLVGVYGVPSDRRALVRLPSGRYIKVKVGDRVDGGTVAAISDSELRYQKGSRTFALTMPSG